jgi:hypothetical protein
VLQIRWLRVATWTLVAVLSGAVAVVVFQTCMRYRYEKIGGVLWRVDQISDQRCRVLRTRIDCSLPKSVSTSTSLSTSTSTSTTTSARHVLVLHGGRAGSQ